MVFMFTFSFPETSPADHSQAGFAAFFLMTANIHGGLRPLLCEAALSQAVWCEETTGQIQAKTSPT